MNASPVPGSHRVFVHMLRLLPFVVALTVTLAAGSALADVTWVASQNASITVTGPNAVTMNFPITRVGDTSYDAWVTYATRDGTAQAGVDYTGTRGSIKIPAGATSVQLPVSILGKSVNAPDETFTLNLTGAVGVGSTPNFVTEQTFTAGRYPYSVTTADLNGDGLPDLIVANDVSNTVSVLMNITAPGAATPSFAVQQTFTVGTAPTSVTTADVNGDGKADLIVVNSVSNTVSVLMNTTAPGAAAASFAAQQTFTVGTAPTSVTTADVNDDGKADLIVANSGSNTVSVLMNITAPGAATPSFAAQQVSTVGVYPSSIATADVNGDGKADLIVANHVSNTVSVLMNTTAPGAATASFAAQQTFTVGTAPTSVTAADMNGDGKADLIVANSGSNTVSVLINTTAPDAATASFALQQTFTVGSAPISVTTADVNGDGKADLIVANSGSTTVSVLMNITAPGATTPSFAAQQTFTVGTAPISVTTADVNGDGKADLIVANSGSNSASVLMNATAPGAATASLAAQQTFTVGLSPYSVTTADVNGDGKADLIVANDVSNTVSVLMNTTAPGAATPSFAAQQTFTVGTTPYSVTTADVNGDGKADLIVANDVSNTVSVLMNITAPGAVTPSFAAQQTFTVGTTPYSVTTADVNGDGRPDVIVANSGSGSNTISVLMNITAPGAATPSFAAQQTFTVETAPSSVTTGDVNGDGLPDLIVANEFSGTVSVLMNTTAPGAATASFAAQQTFTVGTDPISVTTADVNGDGRPDLIVVNYVSNTVSVLLSTTSPGATTPSFAAQQTFAAGQYSESVTTADLNGDGKADLIVANSDSNTVSVLMNTTAPGAATPSFAAQQTFTVETAPSSVTTADLNGDGLPDLIVANEFSGTVSVLINTQYAPSLLTSSLTGTIHYDVPVPVVSLSATALSFGSVALGATGTAQTVTLTNTGNANLTGLAFSFTGTNPGDFSQANTCPATLPDAGGSNSCTITVSFKPAASGARTASLSIVSNAASSPDTVTLSGTGDAPSVASNQNLTLYAGQTLSGQLTAVSSDGHVLTYSIIAQPTHGTLVLAASTGAFTYTPTSGYTGSDSFTFNANDGTATSNTAALSITVNAVPVHYAAPVASDESLTTYAGQTLNGQLAAVASNGHALTYTAVTQPAHGTLTLAASTGAVTYTPASGYTGSDKFTFKANDGTRDSNTATVSITVNAVPTASTPPAPPPNSNAGGGGGGAFGWLGLLLLVGLAIRRRSTQSR